MAGTYPDVPAARIPYDRNGTLLYFINSANVVSVGTQSDMQKLNDTNDSTTINPPTIGYLFLLFPLLFDLSHYFLNSDGGANPVTYSTSYSANTTTGVDGTWTTVASSSAVGPVTTIPNYRTGINAFTSVLTGVKGIRLYFSRNNFSESFRSWHLYGTVSSSQVQHALAFWHPTLDQPLTATPAYLDWGDTPQGSTTSKPIRLKNLSPSLTAHSISISTQALTDATPTLVTQFLFSIGGGTLQQPLSIGDLSPGQVSNAITITRNTGAAAQLGLYEERYVATAASWA